MNNPISSILELKPCVILDGAMATELEARGCDLNDPLWSAKVLLETPDLIREVHADYFAAGADCAITASYQATFQGFAQRGLSMEQAANLMRLSVRLACEARDDFWNSNRGSRSTRVKPFVAASVGPYGAFLADGSEYRGDYGLSLTDLMDFHRPRMAVLANSGADMLACETIPCLLEAQALLNVLEEFPEMTAWFSFSAKDGMHTNHGELISDCARTLEHPQVAAIGVNCTAPEFVTDLVKQARGATTKPILTYPNSGEVYDATQKCWTGESSCSSFAHQARDWFTAGARVIGGCCRTSPEHIRELSTVIDLSINAT
jgi:homocysteine S-methyltransferase